MDIRQKSLEKHYEWNGKIEVISRAPITNSEELSLAYTPGVAEPCLEIQKDYDKSFKLTRRANVRCSRNSAMLMLSRFVSAQKM